MSCRFLIAAAVLWPGCSVVFSESDHSGKPSDASPSDEAGDYYISPTGSDDNEGTTAQSPFRTWSRALTELDADETLVVMPGDYSNVSEDGLATGLPNIDCGSAVEGGCEGPDGLASTCKNGEPLKPIRIVAQQPRTAVLSPSEEWLGEALRIKDCRHWIVEGLVVTGPATSRAEASDHVIRISGSRNTTLRNLVVHRDRDNSEGKLLSVGDSANLLVTDSGFYDFREKAIVLVDSDDANFQRLHISGQDSVGTSPDDDCPGLGDVAIQLSGSSRAMFENVAVEGVCDGFLIQPTDRAAHDIKILSSLVSTTNEGLECQTDCSECQNQECCDDIQSCKGLVVVNTLIQSAGDEGLKLVAPVGAIVDRVTLYANKVGIDVLLEDEAPNFVPCDQSLEVSETLIFGGEVGIDTTVLGSTTIRDCAITADGADLIVPTEPPLPTVDNLQSKKPMDASCRAAPSMAWISDRPLGEGNDTIVGSNVRYVSDAGEETAVSLWTEDGYPCGVLVPGVNDAEGGRCDSLHVRFGIGEAECPLNPE